MQPSDRSTTPRHTGLNRARRGSSRLRGLPIAALALNLLAACTNVAVAPVPERASARMRLRHTIDSLVTRPIFRTAEWALLVVNPARGDTIYAHNPAMLMVPASNMKVITSAVALSQLGPDFRYHTTFATHGQLRNGVLYGDLVVTGRGDPTLSDHVRGSAARAMGELADSVSAHGVRSITGHILSGADNFPGPPVGEGWSWNDLSEDYGAGVDELLYNEGMSRVIVHGPRGDTAVMQPASDPTRAYLAALQQALELRGVSVAHGVGDGVVPRDSLPLDTMFVVTSIPLQEILPYFLKPSQNQIGEVLLRTVGLERTGVGTADSGIAVAARQLTAWGIPPDGYLLHDGSGLARSDLLSPATLVRVFDVMQQSPSFGTYYHALPVAGVDGTIGRRMRGTPAANNVHAKTGSLQWVRSLSGYVTDAAGERLIFSILANKYTTSPDSVTRTADAIAAALAAYRD